MEVIARDLRTLPPAITGAMRRLRRIDIATRDALATIKEKEEQLFEELSKAEKNRKDNKNATVDEEYYTNKMKEIVAEKTAVLAHLDDKLIYSKSLYEFLDLKIQYIGTFILMYICHYLSIYLQLFLCLCLYICIWFWFW